MFWDNLMAECDRQGIKVTPLIKELGISSGNLSSWKKGGNVHSDSLLAIAQRLGVTTDYLLTGKRISAADAVSCVNRNEEIMLMMYRDLTEQQKGKCFSYIQGMYDSAERSQEQSAG